MTGEAARSPPHEGEGSPEPDYPPQKLYASLVSRLSGPYRLPSIDNMNIYSESNSILNPDTLQLQYNLEQEICPTQP